MILILTDERPYVSLKRTRFFDCLDLLLDGIARLCVMVG